MATINGVTFNMQNLRPVAVHRNSISEQPGSDTNFITDMGYDGLVLRLEGYEETLATYDSVISQFMKSGEQTLVHRTGWQFKVYSAQLTPELIRGFADNYFPYDLILLTSTPYRESTSETTRSKTITTNNQEWSADDSANNIDTDGSVDAIPDIQITGGAVGSSMTRTSDETYNDTHTTQYDTTGSSWAIVYSKAYTAQNGRAFVLDTVGIDILGDYLGEDCYAKVTYQAPSLNAGAETDVPGASYYDSYDGNWAYFSTSSLAITCAHNELLTVRWYTKGGAPSDKVYSKNFDSIITTIRKNVCDTPIVYNTDDSTVKSNVANEIDPDMIFKINVDGTGTISYDDDFSTDKYQDAYLDIVDGTYDDPNNELDFTSDGYITYVFDTKYPITGIPALTARIDIDTGTPVIQISSDNSTWYTIDTSVVDDSVTEYELDNASNLSLKGLTTFYIKISFPSATGSIVSFELDVALITIDAEHPKITTGGSASTYRCDQDSGSSMNCTVALYYRGRSWPA